MSAKSIKEWYAQGCGHSTYEISIYDEQNDLLTRKTTDSKEDMEKILKDEYFNDEEASYYEVTESRIIEKGIK